MNEINLHVIVCPVDNGELSYTQGDERLKCATCAREYARLGDAYCLLPDSHVRTAEVTLPERPASLLRRLNRFYSERVEQKSHYLPFFNYFLSVGPGRRWVRTRILQHGRGTVLDIGSGRSPFMSSVQTIAQEYISIDYPHTQAANPAVASPLLWGDGLRLPIRTASVDMVLNILALEHTTDPTKMLSELARVLKPGAKAIIVGPGDVCSLHGAPHHYYNLTQYAYLDQFRRLHLRVQDHYCPAKSYGSMFMLLATLIQRHSWYRTNSFTKLIQGVVLLLSLLPVCIGNLMAWILDRVLPSDDGFRYVHCWVVEKEDKGI